MSHQDTSLPAVGPGSDFYSQYQSADHTLNTAIAQAKISENFEKYLEIFDNFYADDVEVTSEDQPEPIRGQARVGSLLLNFLVPLHVMAEIGGLAVSIRQTAIPRDAAGETHSSWTLDLVGSSGKTCTVSWRTLRKWSGSRVVYEPHYDHVRTGDPLTFDDLEFDLSNPLADSRGRLVTVLGQRNTKAWLFSVRRGTFGPI